MAKCEKREIPQPKHEYVLTLTEREAFALRSLLYCHVGGGSEGTGCVMSISKSLGDAGVNHSRECFTREYTPACAPIQAVAKWPKEAPDA